MIPSLSRTYFEGILPENIFKHESSQKYQREEGQNANEGIFPVTTGKVNQQLILNLHIHRPDF